MSVGLFLRGTMGVFSEDPLTVIDELVLQHYGDELMSSTKAVHKELPTLWIRAHPAADDVEFQLLIAADGAQVLTVSAATSAVGPGYHQDVCELIRTVERELTITWDAPTEDEPGDDSGYFFTNDRDALEREMLQWLSTIARVLSENLTTDGTAMQLSMPWRPRFHGPESSLILTQMGPRDRAWLDRVLADSRAGIDLFPWFLSGRGAEYELGRVLVHLWLDVRWHLAQTDDEELLAVNLVKRLTRAFSLDPTLAYPFASWVSLVDEVIGEEEEDDELAEMIRERAAAGSVIGYRRYEIEQSVTDDWRLTIPGSFSVEADDEGNWSLWEGDCLVQLNALRYSGEGDPFGALEDVAADAAPRTQLVIDGLALPHRAYRSAFVSDKVRYASLTVEVASGEHLLLLTASAPQEQSLAWAVGVIESIQPPSD